MKGFNKKELEERILIGTIALILGTVFLFLSAIVFNVALSDEILRTEPTVITESVCAESRYNVATKTTPCVRYTDVEKTVEFVTYKGPLWTYTQKYYVR